MSGVKGFTIITLIFLFIAVLCLSIGKTEEMTDEEFKEEYKKTLIAEFDYPVDKTLSQINRDGQREPIYEWMDNLYVMADIHKERFTVFLSYREELTSLLKVSKVTINGEEVNFIQEDNVIESDKTRSFVVIDLVSKGFAKDGNILVVVTFEDNKLGFKTRKFVVYDHVLDDVVKMVKETYDEYRKSQVEI